MRDIADRVVQSVRGEVATRYRLNDKKIDVLVRSVDTRAASIEEIRNLIVNPARERPVPLTAVADVTPSRAARPKSAASARNASRDLGRTSSARPRHGRRGLQAILAGPDIACRHHRVPLGPERGDDASRSARCARPLLAMFLVYLVMASQFESLVHPFVILLTIPLAAHRRVWALWLTGTTVNVVAYIGLIMLAGIVVNNRSC